MKIYLLIKPWDYNYADVEVFQTLADAETARKRGCEDEENNSENWFITDNYIQ